MKALSAATLALALGACASARTAPEEVVPAAVEPWRAIATARDRERLREWRTAWVRALRKANAAGHGAEIAREGALLDPDAALAEAAPPPGHYRCRTIKIGAKSEGLLEYISYPPFICRIEASPEAPGVLSFTKLTGSQRPIGRVFPESQRRAIFLGTLQLGDEQGPLKYGHDQERDMAGLVERVGDRRWRLVVPYPTFESIVDVIELIPNT
jgi:hypothetical protein